MASLMCFVVMLAGLFLRSWERKPTTTMINHLREYIDCTKTMVGVADTELAFRVTQPRIMLRGKLNYCNFDNLSAS